MINPASIISFWNDFFTSDAVMPSVREAIADYPDVDHVDVPFPLIVDHDTERAADILEHPFDYLHHASSELTEILKSFYWGPVTKKLELRLIDLPKAVTTTIRALRNEHIGTFISVPGVVTKATQVEPKLDIGAFKCVCGHVQRIRQQTDVLAEPFECPENEGGCGRKGNSTKFMLLFDQSFFEDSQKVEIQERLDTMVQGSQPQRLVMYLFRDLAGAVEPGQDVHFNGIFTLLERRRGNIKSAVFKNSLTVNSIERENASDDIEITDDDLAIIQALAREKDIHSRIARSIAPAIKGMELVKHAVALQLFGGVTRRYEGTYLRGDIHVLLIGDPGTAKSQILRFTAELFPRSVFASGQASTKAGLTATAVKDEFGEGRWTLEAGALVLADGGLAAVDELDKMRPEDRSSMHEALEQQMITVNKAGIKATFRTRCSLLAAANPKTGKFDSTGYKPLPEQFNMDAPLLSRFDVIIPIIDTPNRVQDMEIAAHMSTTHRTGEIGSRSLYAPEEEEGELAKDKDTIPLEILRKYITLARNTIFPVLTDDTAEYLQRFYVDVRNSKDKEEEAKNVTITPRQYEALIRLSEASAKIRLSQHIDKGDVMRAVTIIKSYIEGLTNEKGFHFGVVETGYSTSQREQIKLVEQAIKRICHGTQKPRAHFDQIYSLCNDKIEHEELATILEYMKEKTMVYTAHGEWGLVNG